MRDINIFIQKDWSPPGLNQKCNFYEIYRARDGIYPQYRALQGGCTAYQPYVITQDLRKIKRRKRVVFNLRIILWI